MTNSANLNRSNASFISSGIIITGCKLEWL